jgi:DNA-binding HxlR family transcriptional regulator
MPLFEPNYTRIDMAIVSALRKHGGGLRYNSLHRNSSKEFGQAICIKTFNDHLKRLVKAGIIRKKEETKYRVFYKLKIGYAFVPTELGLENEEEARIRIREELVSYTQRLFAEKDSIGILSDKAELDEDAVTKALNGLLSVIEIGFLRAITYGEKPLVSNYIIDETTADFNKIAKDIIGKLAENKEDVFNTRIHIIKNNREAPCSHL